MLHVESLDDGTASPCCSTARRATRSTPAGPIRAPTAAVLDAGTSPSRCSMPWSPRPTASTLFLGNDIPVRKGTEGWAFVVAHLVDADAGLTEGDSVTVEVDADVPRGALGRALGMPPGIACAQRGTRRARGPRKPRLDSLGSPDFDGAANETSTIIERGARRHLPGRQVAAEVRVRPGRHWRTRMPLAASVNATLASWSRPAVRSASSATASCSPTGATGSPTCPEVRRASPAAAPTSRRWPTSAPPR